MKISKSERLLALALIILLSPIFFVAAIFVFFTSRGPIFYKSLRVGRNMENFYCIKFRTMKTQVTGSLITVDGDPRITFVGKVLRQTKIDELPQLWNVVLGEMRFVGSRPEDVNYVSRDNPKQREVLNSPPGITGPASIYYRAEEKILANAIKNGEEPGEAYARIAAHKTDLDLDYLRSRDWKSDFGLILRTIGALVSPKVKEIETGLTKKDLQQLDSTYLGYSGNYARRWDSSLLGNQLILDERLAVAERLIESNKTEEQISTCVLDLGSGSGSSFRGLFPEVSLIASDILFWRLEQARQQDADKKIVCSDGTELPLRTGFVKAVLISTVLSSISKTAGADLLREATRVLQPGGIILIYDFRIPNPKNKNTRLISRSWLRSNLQDFDLEIQSLTVVPQLARRFRRETMYSAFARFPFLRSHNLVLAKRCAS